MSVLSHQEIFGLGELFSIGINEGGDHVGVSVIYINWDHYMSSWSLSHMDGDTIVAKWNLSASANNLSWFCMVDRTNFHFFNLDVA